MSTAAARGPRGLSALRAAINRPAQLLEARFDAWMLARIRREAGPVTVQRRRLYIVPTRFGYGFAVLGLVILLAAINYSNSMAYALCFLLASLGLVGMHYTHANLLGLRLRAGRAVPVFVGETAHFQIFVDNPSAQARYGLGLGRPRGEPASHVDVDAGADAWLALPCPATRRGWLPLGIVSLSTEFPLGLFHAWTLVDLELSCLIYPRPAPAGLPLPLEGGGSGDTSGHGLGQDEFAGLRSYQAGDALRSIHWKSFPKMRTPMVKQFTDTVERALWLDWSALAGLDGEQRLSQLTRWVIEAEAQGWPYGLALPGRRMPPDHGERHRHECLKALALFEPDGARA